MLIIKIKFAPGDEVFVLNNNLPTPKITKDKIDHIRLEINQDAKDCIENQVRGIEQANKDYIVETRPVKKNEFGVVPIYHMKNVNKGDGNGYKWFEVFATEQELIESLK